MLLNISMYRKLFTHNSLIINVQGQLLNSITKCFATNNPNSTKGVPVSYDSKNKLQLLFFHGVHVIRQKMGYFCAYINLH